MVAGPAPPVAMADIPEFVVAKGMVATWKTALHAEPLSVEEATASWRQAEGTKQGRRCCGDVTVLQGNVLRINSIWAQTEFPALTANADVTSITAVNPITGARILLWSR